MADTDDRRPVRIVDAFTEEPTTGNPAGVVPDATDLSTEQMQAVARELGASETAFLESASEADYRLRYFTPETEVDLCGHATIATFASEHADGAVESGTYAVSTAAGDVTVEVEADGTVWLDPGEPELRPVDLAYADVADALGVDVATLEDVGADLPLYRGSTGVGFLLVPVNYFEHLRDADPDQGALADLASEVGAEGVYAFTFDTIDRDATLHGRAFVPGAGIPEDPVTGTASAVVAAYLTRQGAFDADRDTIVCEQGHFLDRPGTVTVDVAEGVRIGGRAVTTVAGQVRIPESGDDDIIEA